MKSQPAIKGARFGWIEVGSLCCDDINTLSVVRIHFTDRLARVAKLEVGSLADPITIQSQPLLCAFKFTLMRLNAIRSLLAYWKDAQCKWSILPLAICLWICACLHLFEQWAFVASPCTSLEAFQICKATN